MVSLKKPTQQVQTREYTPEHLIAEETTIQQLEVRQKQPPAVQTENDNKQVEVVKDDDKKKDHIVKLDAQDIIESIVIGVIFVAILVTFTLFCGKFLAEGLQLAKDIALTI